MAEVSVELEQGSEIPVKGTPSILYNNLSGAADSFCFAHMQDVYVIRPLGAHKLALRDVDKAPVTHVCLASSRGRLIVAISTSAQIQFWDAHKEVLLASIPHSIPQSRGCVLLDFGERLIACCGHGTGEVSFVEFAQDFAATVIKRQKAHHSAITCVSGSVASLAMVVTGDTSGELQFWNNQFKVYVSAPSEKDCVTAVTCFDSFVAAAYGSGAIRLYLAQTGALRVDIGAHSRWVNAMSYCPQRHLLATVSEDSLLCLWRVPTNENPRVVLVGHKHHQHMIPTGVAFAGDGSSVMVSAYDYDRLKVYPLK